MYVPEIFKRSDRAEILKLIENHPFATVLTWDETGPLASHLPVYYDEKSGFLFGHLAKGNPQARHFNASKETLVIFHGPHTYISPKWYRSQDQVPTWSYAVVHVRGKSRSVEKERLLEILDSSVLRMERGENSYRFSGNPALTTEFKDELMSAILGFEIEMGKVEAKFKLSQNRDPDDYAGVLEGLRAQEDDMSRAVLDLMLRGKASK